MLVTGRRLITLGIVTRPPSPVYWVIVIVPLFVAKSKFAGNGVGFVKKTINPNNSGIAKKGNNGNNLACFTV